MSMFGMDSIARHRETTGRSEVLHLYVSFEANCDAMMDDSLWPVSDIPPTVAYRPLAARRALEKRTFAEP